MKQTNIRSLLIFVAITDIIQAHPEAPSCVHPDTGSGAGYSVTRQKMQKNPSAMLEQQLEQQLRRYAPGGEKEDGGLYATALRELHRALSLQKCLTIMQQREDIEKAAARREVLKMITLPLMKRCGQSSSEHTFKIWYKTLIVTQMMYQLTDMETAGLLKQQLQGQARGMLRLLKDEDYERPDILQRMMKILKEAYTNFTFYEAEDREQPARSREKAQRKKAEEPTKEEPTKENICCCWHEAKPPVEIDNSVNTSCLMPTFNSCQFHQCQFPEQWAPKAVEEGNATKLQEDHTKTKEDADESEKTEGKEETKAKTADEQGSKKEEGVASPEVKEKIKEKTEDKLDSKQEEGVAPPKEAKQEITKASFQENRRQRQQSRRKKIAEEKSSKKNQSEEKTGTAYSEEQSEAVGKRNPQNLTSWIGMMCSSPAGDDDDDTSSGDSFKRASTESASDTESKIVRDPVCIRIIERNLEGQNHYTVVAHFKRVEHAQHITYRI